ncbi:MAG: AAA family ATPase [Rectinemataceae bacterium]
MIESVELDNFGPMAKLDWQRLGDINVVIGANGAGKTFLLKALYSLVKSIEEYRRGNEPRRFEEILATRMFWTFQTELGELVRKGSGAKLSLRSGVDGQAVGYSFGPKTTTTLVDVSVPQQRREENSLFLPAKEVLSLYKPIIESREEKRRLGFDDTYYDLAKVLSIQTKKGKNYTEFAQARDELAGIIDGAVEYREGEDRWIYRKGAAIFSILATSEGIKKIAILDTLLGNRYLTPGSIVFIDEPEAALHPSAISRLMEIICLLSQRRIQFFLATHSYFVIKKLNLLARKDNCSIPVLSISHDGTMETRDLLQGFPDNDIISESVKLYEEEVELGLPISMET